MMSTSSPRKEEEVRVALTSDKHGVKGVLTCRESEGQLQFEVTHDRPAGTEGDPGMDVHLQGVVESGDLYDEEDFKEARAAVEQSQFKFNATKRTLALSGMKVRLMIMQLSDAAAEVKSIQKDVLELRQHLRQELKTVRAEINSNQENGRTFTLL